jgi:hypothetical protein
VDQAALDAFKTRVRLMLLEKLLLRLAFDGAVGAISAAESRERLLDWLDHNSQAADSAYASRFKGDPAQLALYADEVKEVVDGMKTVVEEVYHDWLART